MAAEYNVKADDSERQGLARSLRTQMGYGTAPSSSATKKSTPITRKFISRKVNRTDTLMGIALKYGVTVGELKKENKLWNNDHLFLREELLIPLTPENENCLEDGDTIVVFNGTSSTTLSPSSSHSNLPNGHVDVTSSSSSSSQATTRGNKSSSLPSTSPKSSNQHNNGSDPDVIENADSSKSRSPDDFFSKYDNSIARLKGDVAKMEKNAASLDGIIDANPLALPPRKGSSPSRRGSSSSTNSASERRGRFLSEEDINSSPVLMIRSRTNNRMVKSTIETLQQANDDLFEL
ncbi:unnamed protein product [Lymnaea stagnalis]|uniref:LysM domain-containing protein n=1 Tax=Lymnaea stagnalis TaxID=6523 RepID=A0AAV2HSM6_LYMST